MRTNDFIRKILFPNLFFQFGFWGELIGAGVSILGGMLGGGSDADKAASSQGDATAQQSRIAAEQWEQYKTLYQPLEQEFVEKSRQAIVPDIEGVTGRASADVTQSFDKTRESTNRTLGRYGITPDSGRFESSNRQLDIAQAAQEAGSVNRARTAEIQRADDVGYARMASAVSTGKGIPTSVSSQLGSVSNQYGNQAANYGQAASSTSQFISQLPWNDLFSGTQQAAKAVQSTGITPAIPSNTI